MFPYEEPQGSDEISTFIELPLQETRFSEIPTQELRFTQLYTRESSFPSLGREVKEIDDVFGSTDLCFAKNVTQEDVKDSLRIEDYQLNDMVVDDTVRVDANQNVNHMDVDFSVRVKESKVGLKDMVGEDSVMVKDSYDGVASTDRMDDDCFDASYVYEGISEDEDSKYEPQNAEGLTCYVPDVMFDENDLDVINNEESDSKSETIKKMKYIRNEERGVRAKCVGLILVFDLNDNGPCKDGPSKESASQYKSPTTRSRACVDGQDNGADKDKGNIIIDGGNNGCPRVKDNKEKYKTRAKTRQNQKAWKSPESSPTKSKPSENQESIKWKKIQL
nr:hypothetical protein [Tanacetum cinerariifolium]